MSGDSSAVLSEEEMTHAQRLSSTETDRAPAKDDVVVTCRWEKALVSQDWNPVVEWVPVYSGPLTPDIIEKFTRAAQLGQVGRLIARPRETMPGEFRQ